jgi:integrase
LSLASRLTPLPAACTVPPHNAPDHAPTSDEYIVKETLLSVAVKPILEARREALEADGNRNRYAERIISSVEASCLSEVKIIWKKATEFVEGVADLGAASVTMPRSAALPIEREGCYLSAIDKRLQDAASHSKPHRRWVPLLALMTGMRLRVILYIRASDLVLQEGNLIIDLHRGIDVDGITVEQPLKTKPTKRSDALHQLLHDCGFISWAQETQGHLISDFPRPKDPSDAAQKRMANWMSKLGIRNRQREAFHSLRHNTNLSFRAEKGEHLANYSAATTPNSAGARYGHIPLQTVP